MRLIRIALSSGLWAALAAGGSTAAWCQAPTVSDSTTIERLASLGRLWGVVKYFHPDFTARSREWDSALVSVIPRVRSAHNRDEWAQAVDQLLRVIDDPLTARILPPPRPASPADTSITWLADSTLVVSIGDLGVAPATQALRAANNRIAAAPRIVFDLRTGRGAPRPRIGRLTEAFESAETNGLVLDRPTAAPVRRGRMYSGFPEQDGSSGPTYWPGLQTAAITPRFEPRSSRRKSVVWLVDRGTDIPAVALAMRSVGSATILMEGTTTALRAVGFQSRVDLADSISVRVRTADFIAADGSTIVANRAINPRVVRDSAALAAALDAVRGNSMVSDSLPRVALAPQPEPAYAEMLYPSVEYRLLAAFRFWIAIEYFYPYKSLMGEDWNRVLRESIPRFESARDSVEYALAIAELSSRIHDSHGRVVSKALGTVFGARPGIRARFLGDDLVVTTVVADSGVRGSGIRVGDVVRTVDGESISERRRRFSPYFSHSTAPALDAIIAGVILNGSENSLAHLEVADAARRPHQISLERHQSWRGLLQWTRPGSTWTIVANNIGYVDLERLPPQQIDSMFDALQNTKAIIFDDRSYPQNTVWTIASRLTERQNVIEALFLRPVVTSPDTTVRQTEQWAQYFSASNKARYRGQTVLLVDERTGSLAEHTGLLFKAANATTIIGSQTMGANGDISTVVLPGGILVNFTGQAVQWPNGRQLQRIGLQPDIVVRPTVTGIRAGKDEVLDRAIRFIVTGR